MQKWTRRPQEQEGTYLFSGTFLITRAVVDALSADEILAIYLDIQALVKETGGIDYFQVYENAKGVKLYFIDQCDSEMTAQESLDEEQNYCTLLFDHEY